MRKNILFLLPFCIIITLLWLPFGFHMGATIEEWGLLGVYVNSGPQFWGGPNTILAYHQIRPLMTTLWAIAYSIDPNSWWFWHIELMLSLLVKGASMAWIGYYLTQSRRWSIVAGMLLIVWPADTLQMAFRAMNIGFAEGLAVLSAALLVIAYSAKRKPSQLLLSMLSGLCLIAGAWMYELTLMLAPLAFFLIFAREGITKLLSCIRSKWLVTLAWAACVAVCLGYILGVMLKAKGIYQQEVMGDRHQIFSSVKEHIPDLFTRGFARSLIDGWLDAARIVLYDFKTYFYLVVVAAIVSSIIYVSEKKKNNVRVSLEGMVTIRLLIVGLITLALGYLPFLTMPSHLAISQRTFMFAAPGSVLVFLALLAWFEFYSRVAAVLSAILFITLGVAQQLYQFDSYEQIYDQQRQVLKSIVEQVPTIPAGSTVILLDKSQRINHVWMQALTLQSTLTYLYNKPVTATKICLMPVGTWQSLDAFARTGTCHEIADAWVFKAAAPVRLPNAPKVAPTADIVVKKSNAVVVVVNRDGGVDMTPQVERYRAILQAGHSTTATRYYNLLSENKWPLNFHLFRSEGLQSRYQWNFGHRWNIEQPIQGSGWKEADWIYSPFHQVSAAWINLPKASLLFDLLPLNRDYQLTVHAIAIVSSAGSAIKVKVNNVNVSGKWVSKDDFVARVPRGVLQKGNNDLELEAPTNQDVYGLSFHVDWVKLEPT